MRRESWVPGGVRVEGVQRRRWRKCERRELGMEEGDALNTPSLDVF